MLAARAAAIAGIVLASSLMSESSRSAQAVPNSNATIIGQVRDGRAKTPTTLIPNGLPTVAGATVTVENLGLVATTDSAGRFRFSGVTVPLGVVRGDYIKVLVRVEKAGFATWTVTGAPVYAADYLDLYVELSDRPHTEAYVPREERGPRKTVPGAARALPTSSGKLASRLADGCVPGPETFTGYNSNVYPPGSIRVYRQATGAVETVNFLFYVKSVLPNEWYPSLSPAESLQAGAVAIRNYGWYKVNAASGAYPYGGYASNPTRCFDVDDTESYQVYNPTTHVGRTDNAVAAVWDAVLRPAGTVQLRESLYYAGAVSCAPNYGPNGNEYGKWMSQNGADTCANSGKKWFEILQTFYVGSYANDIAFLSAGPGVAAPPTGNRMDVFVRGSDGQIYQKYWTDVTGWRGWFGPADLGTLPVGSVSDPAATWSDGTNRLDLAVRGNDGAVWVDTWTTATGRWSGWRSLGGDATTGPGLAGMRSGPRVDLLWRNSAHTLQQTAYTGSGDWAYVGPLPTLPVTPDASALYPPTGTWGYSNSSLNAYTASNDDGQQAYTSAWDGSSWLPWSARGYGDLGPIPGGIESKVTGASKASANRIDYFMRAANAQVQWRYSDSGLLSSWVSLGTPVGAQIDSGPGAIWWQNDTMLDVFVRGKDGHLWQARSTDGATWSGWIADLGAYP